MQGQPITGGQLCQRWQFCSCRRLAGDHKVLSGADRKGVIGRNHAINGRIAARTNLDIGRIQGLAIESAPQGSQGFIGNLGDQAGLRFGLRLFFPNRAGLFIPHFSFVGNFFKYIDVVEHRVRKAGPAEALIGSQIKNRVPARFPVVKVILEGLVNVPINIPIRPDFEDCESLGTSAFIVPFTAAIHLYGALIATTVIGFSAIPSGIGQVAGFLRSGAVLCIGKTQAFCVIGEIPALGCALDANPFILAGQSLDGSILNTSRWPCQVHNNVGVYE